jgi:uncharacterized glyoxalase superfamily protein PhnB
MFRGNVTMHLSNLMPFIPSGENYEKARQFFKDLGFHENWGNKELCELQYGEAKFILQNYFNKELQENLMISVHVDDLDGFSEFLKSLKLESKYPEIRFSNPEMRPWGVREIHLIDPAGVCWHFS